MLIEHKIFNKNKAAGGYFSVHSQEESNMSYLKEHNEEHIHYMNLIHRLESTV